MSECTGGSFVDAEGYCGDFGGSPYDYREVSHESDVSYRKFVDGRMWFELKCIRINNPFLKMIYFINKVKINQNVTITLKRHAPHNKSQHSN